MDIWVLRFPDGDPQRISRDGGVGPVWSKDGGTLFYFSAPGLAPYWEGAPVVVEVNGDAPETWSMPQHVMPWPYKRFVGPINYDAGPDGRLLSVNPIVESSAATGELVVLENWAEELERLVPMK
jgi:hypothetical protein